MAEDPTAASAVDHPQAVRWTEDGAAVDLLDQTRLPEEERRLRLESAERVAEAIRSLRVRGAPAIGVAAALGLAVEMARHASADEAAFGRAFDTAFERLRATRPTAVNLFWALERMRQRMEDAWADAGRLVAGPEAGGGRAGAEASGSEARSADDGAAATRAVVEALRAEATTILEEDRAMCRRIAEHGLSLLGDDVRALTHCNAGALATGGMGTALAPLYLAHAQGRRVRVYADETRPVLQGSRLTAWELRRAGVDTTLIADSVAASLMRRGAVDLVIVGADRIAANGDVANKIGTYALAVLARHHGIPFYVAAPSSTIDPDTPAGDDIPIEERDPDEVRRGFGRLTAPADAPVFSPAFDVTPAALVSAIVTDRGVLRPPYADAIARLLREDEAEQRAPAGGVTDPGRAGGA